jgi:hypothetical protein
MTTSEHPIVTQEKDRARRRDGEPSGSGGLGGSAPTNAQSDKQLTAQQDGKTSGSGEPSDSAEANRQRDKQSFFWILTADNAGRKQNPMKNEHDPPPSQDPNDQSARQIVFHLRRGLTDSPPPEQLEWSRAADKVVRALNHLYPPGTPDDESKFRLYYVSVFQLARLTLQDGILTKDAREELATIEKNLIDDAGPSVKNTHILELLRWAAPLSVPFLVSYVLLCYAPEYRRVDHFLHTIHIDPQVLANFMLLWLGCFLGVCLSYALRKHDFTVDDLLTAEADLLRPAIRLVFAGSLAMLLVMLALGGIIDVQVGRNSVSSVADPGRHMFAFFVGTICGISEILLPSKVSEAAVLSFK